MTDRWMKLFVDCLVDLTSDNIELRLTHDTHVTADGEKDKSSGYWDDTYINPILCCSVSGKVDEWMPVFVHEYNHYRQWKEKSKEWKQTDKLCTNDTYVRIIEGGMDQIGIDAYFNAMRDLELDCEKRTVSLLKKYKIQIDTKDYIKKANAYIHFYNYMKQYKRWYPDNKEPHLTPEIYNKCSCRFYKSYDNIPKELLTVYQKTYPL